MNNKLFSNRCLNGAIWALLTLTLFTVLALFMHATLWRIAGWKDVWMLAGLFTAVYAVAMGLFARLERPQARTMLFVGATAAMLMLARVAMLDQMTADYTSFLGPWTQVFREGGFRTLAKNVGDYNLVYQYILLIISRVPLFDLYLIKWVTVCFDFLLALVMMRASGHFAGRQTEVPMFLIVLSLPTMLLDGACWAQCDPVYITFVVLSLYALETDRPYLSAITLSIAFAFKLQTIFFFPVVLLGLIQKRFKARHAAAFFLTYLITMVPALLAGRPFLDALSVYANQSVGQYYDRLTYNAPNLYLFFPMLEFASSQEYTWMRYIDDIDYEATNEYLTEALMPALQSAALYACIILTLIAVIYWLIHYREVTRDMTLDLALFFAIFLPFVMPKIHDRYFFMADMLSVLYAARYKNRRFMPVLVIGASLMCYMPYLTRQRPVDERWLALMMLAALVLVTRDLLVRMRKNRAALRMAKGGEAA
ncbi:MAG: glycosyltransferase 87 family protein [Candidatus Ventricola sp.]